MAAILARLNEFEAIPIILDLMALPGRWDGWTRVDTLEYLVMNGVTLDIASVEKVLDSSIDHLIKEGIHTNQNSFLFKRCLCILLFTSDPSHAIKRIKELISYLPSYEMRDIIIALGQSRSVEAGSYLIELASKLNKSLSLESKLIEALVDIDSSETRNALLGIIDSSITEPKLQLSLYHPASEIFSQAIKKISLEHIEIKDRICQLCREELKDDKRDIIARIIIKIGTTEAVLAGLGLLSDKSNYPIPQALLGAVENILVEKQAIKESSYSYSLVPRADKEIRLRLFAMQNDQSRRRSAHALLGKIYEWRLEYGRPSLELRHPEISQNEYWFIFQPRD